MRKTGLFVLVAVILANIGAWALINHPVNEAPWAGMINGVSFSPYSANENPMEHRYPTAADIDRDLKVLKGVVHSVRTYTSINGGELVPGSAQLYGLPVTMGAWIQGKPEIDEPEIASLIRLTHQYPNINRVIVGNEAILRADVTVDQMIKLIERVKSQVNVPVSTAEPWHVWLKHPELVKAVDYIAVHILPYWEGVPANQAVDYAMYRYNQLKQLYPGKHIMISEIGWPSDGPWRQGAEASLVNEAHFIRDFLNVANQQHLDYVIMEAFDQPWKRTLEGTAGVS